MSSSQTDNGFKDNVNAEDHQEASSTSIPSTGTSSGTAAASTSPPARTPSQTNLHKTASHASTHRQGFAENFRNAPSSPRSQRHPSFTQSAVQELINHPPAASKNSDPRFAGRDWREISVGELVSSDDVKWANLNTSVEEASMILVKHSPVNAVLIRETPSSKVAISTFDYNDLNAYLLVVVGLAKPDEDHIELYNNIVAKGQSGGSIALQDIQPLCRKESLVTLPAEETLHKAIEVFGGGIHRVLISDTAGDVVGILSQMQLIEFFWSEGVNFPAIERLYPLTLRDLSIGTQQIIAVNSDSPLAEALTLMNTEGLTSVAVVDNGKNVVGNISTVDVKHLTHAASAPLLQSSCMHFISVILSERGVEKGRDPFPVFYVNPYSSLAHTVAKLVATQSHRMWVVESASPSPSAPATPQLAPTVALPNPGPITQSPLPSAVHTAVPAAAMPGAHLSGRLTGVVSLTDILNLFAKSSGLHPSDPGEQRARRRRSSSSSVRPSIDSSRPSLDIRR